jgi:hypothetical protein
MEQQPSFVALAYRASDACHPNSEGGNDEIQNVQREDFYFVGITF